MKTGTRRYRMGTRAAAAAATAERVLDATVELYDGDGATSLDDIARRAGVSTQTVIRRFGGKDGVVAAAAEREVGRVRRQRDQAPVGHVEGAVRVLVEHYEEHGDRVLRLLARESGRPELRSILDRGRALHHDWCSRVFAPAVAGLRGVERERRFAQLVAICDVYTWKLLRRDRGLSRRQTELALVEILRPLTKEA